MNWQSLLPSGGLTLLASAARVGLITDMDGTISPIVDLPEDAHVTPRSHDLLHALHAQLALVAVISGRAVEVVRDKVGLDELVYVGNHGLEWWTGQGIELAPEAAAYRDAIVAVRDAVAPRQHPGMSIEDKDATISIHYRRAADPDAAAAEFGPLLEKLTAEHGLRLFQGRMIFEVRPPLDVNKGTAFARLVEQYDLAAAVYVGDDTTDADAFRMARELRCQGTCYALALGVEADDTPSIVRETADVMIPGIHAVESFFEWLVDARNASST